jgi:hypothetical protein
MNREERHRLRTLPPPGDLVVRVPRGYRPVAVVCESQGGEMGVLMASEDPIGVEVAIAQLERAIRWLRTRRLLV